MKFKHETVTILGHPSVDYQGINAGVLAQKLAGLEEAKIRDDFSSTEEELSFIERAWGASVTYTALLTRARVNSFEYSKQPYATQIVLVFDQSRPETFLLDSLKTIYETNPSVRIMALNLNGKPLDPAILACFSSLWFMTKQNFAAVPFVDGQIDEVAFANLKQSILKRLQHNGQGRALEFAFRDSMEKLDGLIPRDKTAWTDIERTIFEIKRCLEKKLRSCYECGQPDVDLHDIQKYHDKLQWTQMSLLNTFTHMALLLLPIMTVGIVGLVLLGMGLDALIFSALVIVIMALVVELSGKLKANQDQTGSRFLFFAFGEKQKVELATYHAQALVDDYIAGPTKQF